MKPPSAAPLSQSRPQPFDSDAPYSLELPELVAKLDSDTGRGLTDEQAAGRLALYGPNRLPEPPRKNPWLALLSQFTNPLVLTLLGAAVIAVGVAVTSHEGSWLMRYGDSIAILLIVILNAFLGYFQERRAEAALDALQRMTAPTARVRRNGQLLVVQAPELVPGDLLEIETGDAVPADARLIETVHLAAEEAMLTGESAPSAKSALTKCAPDCPISDRETMLFMGTTIVRGKGRALVVSTAVHTELGKIGEMIRRVERDPTPLEQRLSYFGHRILWSCLSISALLFAWGMISGRASWHRLLLESVSLAVAAIPEGLPAITTITLALGMQRMAKRGAIVRKLPAVETLGSATVICTDKTGTLTQNEMTVRQVWTAGVTYQVSGQGYDPSGVFTGPDGRELDPLNLPSPLRQMLSTAALCNNASLQKDAETGAWKVIGDPTEGALLALSAKGNCDRESIAERNKPVREMPFDSDRKRMTVITIDESGHEVAHVKGSVDVLIDRCVKVYDSSGTREITNEDKHSILAEAERMSTQALRVLAIARRKNPDVDPEQQLTFLGLAGMIDPPRVGVGKAIEACRTAGVRVVMITGDHKLTAMAIARELGLWEDGDEAVTGAELAALSHEKLTKRLMNVRVFARTTAEQKLQLVKAYKALGHIVAMTGDGVNDAPALREAHIGVAMGLGGTDVARQAADLVLADDNFVTIVEAVREGRAIFRNIQKFIYFLLSSNAGLCVAVFVIAFVGGWSPLTPLMILWINLVTNGLPALALGVDPPDPTQMREKPRASTDGLLARRDYFDILVVGVVMGGMATLVYVLENGGEHARTGAFTLLAISPLIHAWSCRSSEHSLFSARPLISLPIVIAITISAAVHFSAILIPALRPVFRTYTMDAKEWIEVICLSLAIVPAMEIKKAIRRLQLRLRAARCQQA